MDIRRQTESGNARHLDSFNLIFLKWLKIKKEKSLF